MSWDCPYQALKGTELCCTRLNLPCKPMQKGCILDEWRRSEGAGKKQPPKATRGKARKTSSFPVT